MNLSDCDRCGGFIPGGVSHCPHCDGRIERSISRTLMQSRSARVAAGSVLAMTLMACYGAPQGYVPPEPPEPPCEEGEATGADGQCQESGDDLTIADPEATEASEQGDEPDPFPGNE